MAAATADSSTASNSSSSDDSAAGVALRQLALKLQRDVNCLSDPDRTTRRRALTKLEKVLVQEPQGRALLSTYLINTLAAPLVQLLSDPVEKCRELGSGTLVCASSQLSIVVLHCEPYQSCVAKALQLILSVSCVRI
jgi:hypothetical protein